MAHYEAYIIPGWQEHGLATVFVARRRAGSADYGVFLVDTWCLGVKEAVGETDVPDSALAEALDQHLPEPGREPIDPACAKKLIDGAVAYAERLGFAPHRDYRKARRALSGLDAGTCTTGFSFGHAGRPHYVQGDEDDATADRVVARLEAVVGADGYEAELSGDGGASEDEDPDPVADEIDELLATREALIEFLDAEPEAVPKFYAFSGLVAAALLCPTPVPPQAMLAALWGPAGKRWKTKAEVGEFIGHLMLYWNFMADCVSAVRAPDADPDDPSAQPLVDFWDEDCPDDIEPGQYGAGVQIEWAQGFLRGTEEWSAAWAGPLSRLDLADDWTLIRAWAEFTSPGNKDRVLAALQQGRSLNHVVVDLARAL